MATILPEYVLSLANQEGHDAHIFTLLNLWAWSVDPTVGDMPLPELPQSPEFLVTREEINALPGERKPRGWWVTTKRWVLYGATWVSPYICCMSVTVEEDRYVVNNTRSKVRACMTRSFPGATNGAGTSGLTTVLDSVASVGHPMRLKDPGENKVSVVAPVVAEVVLAVKAVIGQLERDRAAVLAVSRHARKMMRDHGMRFADIEANMPYVMEVYFFESVYMDRLDKVAGQSRWRRWLASESIPRPLAPG